MARWKLFGRDTTAALPAELRGILAQVHRERTAFEALLAGARESAQQLSQLAQPIAEAQKVVMELQTRVKALERLAPVLATLDEQTEAVSRTQRRTETQVDQTAQAAQTLSTEIAGLRGAMDAALALKSDLTALLQLADGLKSLRGDAEALAGQVRDISQGFDLSRQRQDELRRAGDAAAARLQTFEQRQQQLQAGVTGFGQAFARLTEAAAGAAETERQLSTLKSLADHVTQQVAVLEQQRDAVERAVGRATRLDELVTDIDTRMHGQEQRGEWLSVLETRVTELQALHHDLLAGSREVSGRQEHIVQADQELRGRLSTLGADVQRVMQGVELENQGLEAVGQHILELRSALADVETQCRALTESSRSIGNVQSAADRVATRLSGIADTITQLQSHAERLGAVQAAAERLGPSIDDMTQRVARLEQAQPTVEAVVRDHASLKGVHEALQDALERMRGTEQEIGRAREAQSGTSAWLAEVTASVEALRGQLDAVDEMKPTVESVRSDADHLAKSMVQIEARRQLVEDLNTRLAEATTAASQLEERTRALLTRVDSADEQFQAVAQLNRVLGDATERTAALTATLDDLDGRAGNLRFVQKRMEQIEERLAKLQGAEGQLARALEQGAQRQATLEALRADLYRLFEVAERTVEHVRSLERSDARIKRA